MKGVLFVLIIPNPDLYLEGMRARSWLISIRFIFA